MGFWGTLSHTASVPPPTQHLYPLSHSICICTLSHTTCLCTLSHTTCLYLTTSLYPCAPFLSVCVSVCRLSVHLTYLLLNLADWNLKCFSSDLFTSFKVNSSPGRSAGTKGVHNKRSLLILPRSASGVSICTFVLAEQVNWIPLKLHQVSVFVLLVTS